MKIKTSELTGAALDWAVAKCEGVRTYTAPYQHTMTGLCVLDADLVDMETDGPQELRYSRDWSQGGPIIEREKIRIVFRELEMYSYWFAEAHEPYQGDQYISGKGQTPLVAAMRCYVASKLGSEVEIPEELLL
jgi:hypothetical protein